MHKHKWINIAWNVTVYWLKRGIVSCGIICTSLSIALLNRFTMWQLYTIPIFSFFFLFFFCCCRCCYVPSRVRNQIYLLWNETHIIQNENKQAKTQKIAKMMTKNYGRALCNKTKYTRRMWNENCIGLPCVLTESN